MKTRVVSFLILGLLLTGLAFASGCSKNSGDSKAGSATNTGTLTIAGSTSVQPFSEVLAEKFMGNNPNVKVTVQGGGSSQGIEAAVSGVAQIGSISRDIADAEKSKGLVATPIAVDGVSIVLNPANSVTALKIEQVKDIYLGNIKNWKELGGNDAPITVVSREDGSGTREVFTNIIMNKENIVTNAVIQNSTGAVRTTVSGDKNAIGYISMSNVNSDVKAINLDGVQPNEANVKNGTYKLQRPFIYVTKGAPTGLAKTFIDFVLSDAGQNIMVEEGAFKVK